MPQPDDIVTLEFSITRTDEYTVTGTVAQMAVALGMSTDQVRTLVRLDSVIPNERQRAALIAMRGAEHVNVNTEFRWDATDIEPSTAYIIGSADQSR